MNKRIKFGVLCNSLVFETWEASCLQHLLNHPEIELKLLIIHDKAPTPSGYFKKLKEYPYRSFLYRAYKRFFLKASSYTPVSFELQFKDIPKLFCKVKQQKYDEYFLEDDVKAIKSMELDFLLRFGFNIIKGSILESCTYGVWSFHHADNDFIRGGPIGFWEIFLRKNTSAAVLQQLNNKLDKGKILRKGYLKTINHSLSENIDQLTQMAAIWPLQVCIDILNKESVFNYHAPQVPQGKLYKYPRNIEFIYFLLGLIYNKFIFHFAQLFLSESWQIAFVKEGMEELLQKKSPKIVYLSKANTESYWADPFLLPTSFSNKIVFEFYSYRDKIGKIALSDRDGKNVRLIQFDEEVHRSYPFVIEHNHEFYIVPEQAESGKLTLYKIDEVDKALKVTDLLIDFKARDASIIFFNEKWWLFCTRAGAFENAELHVFYSNSLFEPFSPHLNNPVKIDVRNSRPAGSLFIKNRKLYRTAQNCAMHYGHKINLNLITHLSASAFEETTVSEIEAGLFGNFKGIHHISERDGIVVIDLKQSRFSFQNFKNELKRKLKKMLYIVKHQEVPIILY